ncbi:MAG: hypothetical protein AB3N64_03210 [Puniceicoccaceae bacterium]
MKRVILPIAWATLGAASLNASGLEHLDGSLDWMATGDVKLGTSLLGASIDIRESSTLDIQLELSLKEVEYRPNAPIDPLGMDTDLDDTLTGINLALEQNRERHRTTLGASAYKGFRSYSSLWIDEYYRQQYGLGGLPGVSYEDPDPHGYGLTASHRYEVLPSSGFLTFSASYLYDRVAPGYEIEDLGSSFELTRSETILHTWTGSVEYEGLINKSARTRQVASLSKTSTRELRFSWSGALNVALGPKWISRSTATFATENPDFEAWSVAQTFEREFDGDWSVSLTARYYEDTGQIESANLISSAAPALETQQLFLTLRRSLAGSESAFSLSFGPYLTDYAETGIGTERFENLYADRDWWWGRFAFRKEF